MSDRDPKCPDCRGKGIYWRWSEFDSDHKPFRCYCSKPAGDPKPSAREVLVIEDVIPDQAEHWMPGLRANVEAYANAKLEEAAQAAEAEPEFEGEPPLWHRAIMALMPVRNARASCRATKRSIAAAIRALKGTR